MPLPIYYHTARLARALVILPQMGLVYLESDRDTAFFLHIEGMVGHINFAITVHDGDIDIGERFDGHWAVIRLHSGRPPGSITAFTVWGSQWERALQRIRGLQQLARTRSPGIRARRANELAKLTAFKQHGGRVLPTELVHLILAMCITRCAAKPAAGPRPVHRIETDSYRRLRTEPRPPRDT